MGNGGNGGTGWIEEDVDMLCEDVSRSTWMGLHLQRRSGWTDDFTLLSGHTATQYTQR